MSYFGLNQSEQEKQLSYAKEHPIQEADAQHSQIGTEYIVTPLIVILAIIFILKLYRNGVNVKILGSLVFFAISIIQIAAIIGAFHLWLGWNAVLSVILALVLTWFPLIGAVLGVLGAVHAWHWEWWQAILLFAWPVVLMLFFGVGGFVFDKFARR